MTSTPSAIRDFHAHIYFDPTEVEQAKCFERQFSANFGYHWATFISNPLDLIRADPAKSPYRQKASGQLQPGSASTVMA